MKSGIHPPLMSKSHLVSPELSLPLDVQMPASLLKNSYPNRRNIQEGYDVDDGFGSTEQASFWA